MSARRLQQERIAGLLTDKCNVALTAPTGAGKSWAASQVCSTLEAAGEVIVRVDLSSDLPDARAVFFAIARGIGHEIDPAADLHTAWRDLKRLLRGNLGLTVVVEEFDEVVRYRDSLDFLKLLRELMHRPWETGCSCLIVSRRSLEAIETEVRGISTLASLCISEHLGGVSIADLRDNWPKAAGLSDDEMSMCMEWSGGYPPLVRYWLSVRPDLNPSIAAEHQQVVEFERLIKHVELMGLWKACAQLVLGPVLDDWILERRELETLGVLARPDESSTAGYGAHHVFRACLKSRTWALDPWGLLGQAEIRLRSVIDEVLTDRYGADWPTCRELKGVRSLSLAYESAMPKAAEDVRRFGRSASWLAYTYPQELGDIITSNWKDFAAVFAPGDKNVWKVKFSTLATYRTPVAHNRAQVLSEAQRVQCRIYAEEVIRAADQFSASDADSESL